MHKCIKNFLKPNYTVYLSNLINCKQKRPQKIQLSTCSKFLKGVCNTCRKYLGMKVADRLPAGGAV